MALKVPARSGAGRRPAAPGEHPNITRHVHSGATARRPRRITRPPPKPSPMSARNTQLDRILCQPAQQREHREPQHGDLKHPDPAVAVGEHAGQPTAHRRGQQGGRADPARLSVVVQEPGAQQDRNQQAVNLHVGRVRRPSAEARPECSAFGAVHLPKPRACLMRRQGPTLWRSSAHGDSHSSQLSQKSV